MGSSIGSVYESLCTHCYPFFRRFYRWIHRFRFLHFFLWGENFTIKVSTKGDVSDSLLRKFFNSSLLSCVTVSMDQKMQSKFLRISRRWRLNLNLKWLFFSFLAIQFCREGHIDGFKFRLELAVIFLRRPICFISLCFCNLCLPKIMNNSIFLLYPNNLSLMKVIDEFNLEFLGFIIDVADGY